MEHRLTLPPRWIVCISSRAIKILGWIISCVKCLNHPPQYLYPRPCAIPAGAKIWVAHPWLRHCVFSLTFKIDLPIPMNDKARLLWQLIRLPKISRIRTRFYGPLTYAWALKTLLVAIYFISVMCSIDFLSCFKLIHCKVHFRYITIISTRYLRYESSSELVSRSSLVTELSIDCEITSYEISRARPKERMKEARP